jgi:hypothetical protein
MTTSNHARISTSLTDVTLDRAFREHDSVQVLKALEFLRPMNREFMRMASRRYAELVAERW